MEKKIFKRIYIEINNTCNFNCSFCIHTKREKRYMSTLEFKHIIDEIKPYTSYVYLHLMGEPLIHPHLFEFIKIAKENEIAVNLTTNASKLKDNCDNLIENEVRQLNLSLHSIESNDESFYKYIDNVFESIDKLNQKTQTYINLRLWDINQNKESDIIRHQYIINKIKTLYPNSLSLDSIEELKNYRTLTIKENLFMSIDKRFIWPSLDNSINSKNGYCRGLKDMCAILVDGTVVPCCLDSNGDINLGNIFNESFSNIINSKKTKDIIDGFNDNKCIEELCQKCSYRNRFKK